MDDSKLAETLKIYRETYPPFISFKQAAEISQLPLGTIYDYSGRKLFDGFKIKVGKYRRLDLARFIEFVFANKPTNQTNQSADTVAPR